MKREEFILKFLEALGAESVLIEEINRESIRGTVVYNSQDPDERQEFCWHRSVEESISSDLFVLVDLILKHRLLDIDKLKTPREELRLLCNQNKIPKLSQTEFDGLMNELIQINVHMIDDGEETDSYFIHE